MSSWSNRLCSSTILLLSAVLGWPLAASAEPVLVEVQKIWDQAPHNAFTDLVRYKDRWCCVFREGQRHVSPDGAIRVLVSSDGKRWESAALLKSSTADLRDPKLTITPQERLQLSAAGALHQPMGHTHQTYTWFSDDGVHWSEAQKIGEPNFWLWRITWHGDTAYGVGYGCGKEKLVRLYRSKDGVNFQAHVPTLFNEGYPNESALVFLPDQTCLCLLRRDKKPAAGLLGTSKPPYAEWSWQDLGVRIGGPNMIRLPDGRLLAVVRLHDGKVRTSLGSIDPKDGKFRELLALPSGGDTSYAGMAFHDGLLHVSYYSSHEGKTNIYLARIKP